MLFRSLKCLVLAAAFAAAQYALADDHFLVTNRALRAKDAKGRVSTYKGLVEQAPDRPQSWMRDADPSGCRVFQLPGKFSNKRAERPQEYQFLGSAKGDGLMPVVEAAKRLAGEQTPVIVVHIHGFRNDVNTAMEASEKMQRGLHKLGVHPAFITASWPSDTNGIEDAYKNYVNDLDEARRSHKPFAEFLNRLGELCTAEGVRLIVTAHSMGSRVLDGALKDLWRPDRLPFIDEAVLISADINNGALEPEAAWNGFGTSCRLVTCYFTRKDFALRLSRFTRNIGIVGDYGERYDSRLGLTGPRNPARMIANAVAVDSTNIVFSKHSLWFDMDVWMADFARVVAGDLPDAIAGREAASLDRCFLLPKTR